MSWIIVFLVAPWLTLFVHESSHALMAKKHGGAITSFKPWPHRDGDQWWFGYVRWNWTKGSTRSRWIPGSPLLFNTPLAIGLAIGARWWPPLIVWAAWEAVDHLWWWRGYLGIRIPFTKRASLERLDGQKFRSFES
jgi:hypothetical protein